MISENYFFVFEIIIFLVCCVLFCNMQFIGTISSFSPPEILLIYFLLCLQSSPYHPGFLFIFVLLSVLVLEAFLKHLVILFSTSALIVVKYTIYKMCLFTMFVSIHCSGIKHIHFVVPLLPSMGRTFSASQSEILYLLNHTPPFPFYLAPNHHCTTFFLWNLVTLRTSYKCNHTVLVLFAFRSFHSA